MSERQPHPYLGTDDDLPCLTCDGAHHDPIHVGEDNHDLIDCLFALVKSCGATVRYYGKPVESPEELRGIAEDSWVKRTLGDAGE